MAMFVHITLEKNTASIQRRGLKAEAYGLYAMPVTPNFYLTHQWVRELRRFGRGAMIAAYFRVPDALEVWAGRYNQTHQQMTAAGAIATLMQQEQLGFEVILPYSVRAKDIHKIRKLYQGIGWRYWPQAHGQAPCGCPYCQYGQFGGRRLRQRYPG